MRYRVIIYERGVKDKYLKSYSFESHNIDSDIENLYKLLSEKINLRRTLFNNFKDTNKHLEFLNSDLFDYNSVGNDISRLEFLQNEIFFDTLQKER